MTRFLHLAFLFGAIGVSSLPIIGCGGEDEKSKEDKEKDDDDNEDRDEDEDEDEDDEITIKSVCTKIQKVADEEDWNDDWEDCRKDMKDDFESFEAMFGERAKAKMLTEMNACIESENDEEEWDDCVEDAATDIAKRQEDKNTKARQGATGTKTSGKPHSKKKRAPTPRATKKNR